MIRRFLTGSVVLAGLSALAISAVALPSVTVDTIEGQPLDLAEYAGKTVLVVNTASRCGFTPQYEALQALQDSYGDRGFTVLAVPSNSFRQELSSSEEVAEFCEVHFGTTFPMTDIAPVLGRNAHPVFAWLADQGVRPRWNFHKALIAPDGSVVKDWPSQIKPDSPSVTSAIEANLPQVAG